MKIAFASTDGKTVNRNFDQARDFTIWHLHGTQLRNAGKRSAITTNRFDRACQQARLSAIADCDLVCSLDIAPEAAAQVARHLFHLKTIQECAISEILERLRQVAVGTPPPWLQKALRDDAAR
nr:NifB/NifX family molybdenum-iron cluster-binding protein [uncultured Desulfuromonas sp.]